MRNGVACALALGVALTLGACSATDTPNDAALCAAYAAGQSHVEVVADGTVEHIFGVRPGRTSPHEGFLLRLTSGCSIVVRVEVNTDFTGTIPLDTNQRVLVKGEYEYYPRGGVIHWTHRDPRNRHANGYIDAGGTMYY